MSSSFFLNLNIYKANNFIKSENVVQFNKDTHSIPQFKSKQIHSDINAYFIDCEKITIVN